MYKNKELFLCELQDDMAGASSASLHIVCLPTRSHSVTAYSGESYRVGGVAVAVRRMQEAGTYM